MSCGQTILLRVIKKSYRTEKNLFPQSTTYVTFRFEVVILYNVQVHSFNVKMGDLNVFIVFLFLFSF